MALPEIVGNSLDAGLSNPPSVAYSRGGAALKLHAIRRIPFADGGNGGSIQHFARGDKTGSHGSSISS